MVAEEGEERHDAVAEGDALHDSPDAEMAKAEEIAFDGVVEPVDEKADGKQQHRSLDDTTDDLGRGFELRLHQREVTRDTHDEEEEGEDEVAGSHAVRRGRRGRRESCRSIWHGSASRRIHPSRC